MRRLKFRDKDIMDKVEGTEDLADAMVDSENPGSGIPFDAEITTSDTPEKTKGRKVDEGELRKKLERGYI